MSRFLHALLRRVLPASLRRRQGDAMAEAFAAALSDARANGSNAVLCLWCREALDLWRTAALLRLGRHGPSVDRSDTHIDRSGARVDRSGPRASRSGVHAGRSGPYTSCGGARRGRSSPRASHRPGRRSRRAEALTAVAADVRTAARTLRRRPGFTVFAALTMALGIAAATSVFSAIDAALLNPLPYAGSERMLALFESSGNDRLLLSPSPESVARWRAQQDLFEAVEPMASSERRLTGQGAATTVAVGLIRPEFHELTDRRPVLGRPFTAEELKGPGQHVVLLDHAFWRARFNGSADVLGKTVELNGEPWTIVGVMPPRTMPPNFDTARKDLWLPLSEERQTTSVSVTALMRPGVTLADVSERLEELHRQDQAESVQPPAREGVAMLIAEQRGLFLRDSLELLSLAVGLLVLIASMNVASLLVGSYGERRTEMAVRRALGATWRNVFRQVLAQSLVLAMLGGGMGIVLTRAGLAAFSVLRPDNLRVLDGAAVNAWTLLFALMTTVAVGVASGMLPALALLRDDGTRSTRGPASGSGAAGQRLRWGLIAVEVAFSFVLLVASFLVAADLYRLQRADVGFEAGRLAVVGVSLPPWKYDTEPARRAAWDDLEARLSGIDGLQQMTMASAAPPGAGYIWGKVAVDDQPPSEEPRLFVGPAVRADYFTTLGQKIVAGRPFTPAEVRDGADVIILGEAVAQNLLPDRNPLGARLRFLGTASMTASNFDENEMSWTVVGVVADVAMNGPAGVPELQMYQPLTDENAGAYRAVVLRPVDGRDARELLPAARQVVVAEDPDILVMELSTGADLMSATLGKQRFMTSLLAAFAVLALVLASVGLYGVVSALVGQRTRELGIRMALGADARRIRLAVLRGGAGAVAAGIALGMPLVWAATRLAAAEVFADLSGEPALYVVAAVMLALNALMATYLPTRRATRIDPMKAIRDT